MKCKPLPRAFILLEVIVALAIVAIALTALLRLHVISLTTTDRAQNRARAAMLAEAKLGEAPAQGDAKVALTSGVVNDGALELHWEKRITDMHPADFDERDMLPVRQVSVEVRWREGWKDQHMRMMTYAAGRGPR